MFTRLIYYYVTELPGLTNFLYRFLIHTLSEAPNTVQVTKMFSFIDGQTSAHTFAAIKPLKQENESKW